MATTGKSKRSPRPPGARRGAMHLKFRTRWRHVLLIDEMIRSGQAPNCRRMAERLEVCHRTILRDIDFLRYDLGAPVEYDPARGGYVYTEPNWTMPSFRITEGELFAMLVAEKALAGCSGAPWADRLRKVLERMMAALPDRIEVAPRDLLGRVDFAADAPAITDPQVLQTVAEAVAANRVVEATYRALGGDRPKRYILHPYVLRRARGAWYLAARDTRSGRVPLFQLSRMASARATKATFEYDGSGFDPKAYFAATFGAYESASRYPVTIEFSAFAAQLVAERQWHSTQKLTALPGGRLRFEAEVSHLDDIWPWVLSWGPQARAVAPKELVAVVGEQARRTAGLYGP